MVIGPYTNWYILNQVCFTEDHFSYLTPTQVELGKVLTYIKEETFGPDYKIIILYVSVSNGNEHKLHDIQ